MYLPLLLPPECLPEPLLTSRCPRHVGQDLILYLRQAGHHGLVYPHFLCSLVGSLCLPIPSYFSDYCSPSTLSPRDCLEESALLLVHPTLSLHESQARDCHWLPVSILYSVRAARRLNHSYSISEHGSWLRRETMALGRRWSRPHRRPPSPFPGLEPLPSDGNMSDLSACHEHVSCGPWQSPGLCPHPKADRACRTWEGNWEKRGFPGYEPRKHWGIWQVLLDASLCPQHGWDPFWLLTFTVA